MTGSVYVLNEGAPQLNGERLDREVAEATRRRQHVWTMAATWRVDPAKMTGADGPPPMLDRENLLALAGPGCFVCGQFYSDELAARPCTGNPRGWQA